MRYFITPIIENVLTAKTIALDYLSDFAFEQWGQVGFLTN